MRPRQDQPSKMDNNKSALPGEWLFYLIAIIGSLISLLFWYASVVQSNSNLAHTVRLQTQNVANDIKVQFELRISALKHMAKHLDEESKPSFKNWQSNVVEFVSDYGGFVGIEFLDPNFKTLWESNNDSNTAQTYKQFLLDYASRLNDLPAIWVSPSQNMLPNNKIVFIVARVGTPDHVKGYLVSIVDLRDALNIEINHDDYAVTIYDNTQKIFQDNTNMLFSAITPGSTNLDIYGASWRIYVKPTAHLISTLRTGLPTLALILGICIAILFAIASHLAQLARQSARSLDEINFDLKKEIAERKDAEDSKQKLEKALLQGQKLQAIGTLAGGIAHDFNNLLYAIMGYVEMGREDVPKESVVYENLGKVLEASRRGQELIARILTFSRRQHHALKPIPIKSTIESVLSLLRPTIPASARIDFDVREIDEHFQILGDQTRLHQVIVNIVNNAVDAIDAEGTVTIRLSVVDTKDEILKQFPDVASANYCRIDIIDAGHGMDQTTVERIFEPFFTTKEVGKGTGLGLATAHSIVREHHGQILVKSQLGSGTNFIILLPEYKI
jgi:signal transduction histidine kinase